MKEIIKEEKEGIIEEVQEECQYLETKKKLSVWVWVVIVAIVALVILLVTNQTGPIITK